MSSVSAIVVSVVISVVDKHSCTHSRVRTASVTTACLLFFAVGRNGSGKSNFFFGKCVDCDCLSSLVDCTKVVVLVSSNITIFTSSESCMPTHTHTHTHTPSP